MPGPSWEYDCPCRSSGGGRPECPDCGKPGRYVGYRRSVVEHWGYFQRATGLNPLSGERKTPHGRAIMERLVTCSLCEGHGYLSDRPGSYCRCPRCGGDGRAIDGKFSGDVAGGAK